MKRILPAAVVTVLLIGGFARAADLAPVDRSIKKELRIFTGRPATGRARATEN
jgi:hypothetical protein